MRNFKLCTVLLLTASIIFSEGCKKADSPTLPQGPDFETKMRIKIEGFVTDENNTPLGGALVKAGAATVISNQYGYFSFDEAEVSKISAVISVQHPDYLTAFRSSVPKQDQSAFLRVKMMRKISAGSFDAASGGSVTIPSGLEVSLPANGVVDAGGVLYSGTVTVVAENIDPSSGDFALRMPGDLQAVDETGKLGMVKAFGMSAIKLLGDGGESLQIAPGKKAVIGIPITASATSSAPANSALWYFDEQKGIWMREGEGMKNGTRYTAEVSHFSFWSFASFSSVVPLDFTILDSASRPVAGALVRVTNVSDPSTVAYAYTNSNGYLSGVVPEGTDLVMEIFAGLGCTTPVHTVNLPASNSAISFGDITVPSSQSILISGTIATCSLSPVADGYLYLIINGQHLRYSVTNGSFQFPLIHCLAGNNVTVIAGNAAASVESSPQSFTVTSPNLDLGNIQACGNTAQEFLYCTINGVDYSFVEPTDSIQHSFFDPGNYSRVSAFNDAGDVAWFEFENTDILTVGWPGNIVSFYSSNINDTITPQFSIFTTESAFWGTGGFLGGYFQGQGTGRPPANTVYNVSATYRVRN